MADTKDFFFSRESGENFSLSGENFPVTHLREWKEKILFQFLIFFNAVVLSASATSYIYYLQSSSESKIKY